MSRHATGSERVVGALAVSAGLLTLHSVLNWWVLRKPPAGRTDPGSRPSMSVLIPARDEADRLGPTLAAVLAQTAVDAEVIVLDDGSVDDTVGVARAVADGDPRFRLLPGRPLPEGWLGKPHACAQLADAARGEVLVFLDADVALRPGALAACADLLEESGLDMVSPYPRQIAVGAGERLVQPLLQWSWLTFLPLRLAERSPQPSLTAGNGQLLVCRAGAYRTAGGHDAVRHEVLEDVALARAFKEAGLRVGMADGTSLATCRMYDGWPEVRDGYTKSLWAAFGSPAGAVAVLVMLCGLYVVPPLALAAGLVLRRHQLARVGGAGYAAGAAGRAFTAWRTGGRVADATAHPLSILLLAHLTRESHRRRAAGSLTWRGRRIP